VETGEGGGASGCVAVSNMKAQENRIVPPKCLWIQLQQTGNFVRWADKQTDTDQDRDIMCTVTADRYYKKVNKNISGLGNMKTNGSNIKDMSLERQAGKQGN
jgi:hypothetical protein